MHRLELAIEPLRLAIDWEKLSFWSSAGLGRDLSWRFNGFRDLNCGTTDQETMTLFPLSFLPAKADPQVAQLIQQATNRPLNRFPGNGQGTGSIARRRQDLSALLRNRGLHAWIKDGPWPSELTSLDLSSGWVIRNPLRRKAAVFLETPTFLRTKVAAIIEAVYFDLSLAFPAQDALLLHGVGLGRPHGGLLVLGLAGAGKSTLARLGEAHRIIADDGIVVSRRNRRFLLLPSPFNQQLNPRGNACQAGRQSLAMGLFLTKARRVRLDAVAPEEACCRILKNHIHFFRYFDSASALAAFALVVDICRQVPFFDLHFKKDPSFWPAVDEAMQTLTKRKPCHEPRSERA